MQQTAIRQQHPPPPSGPPPPTQAAQINGGVQPAEGTAAVAVKRVPTLYVRNLNEKIKAEGKWKRIALGVRDVIIVC